MKAWGAIVTTTCSTDAVTMVSSLGADYVIDYKTQNVQQELMNMKGYERGALFSLPDKFLNFFHLNYETVRYTIYLDVNDFGELKIFLYKITRYTYLIS